MGIVGKLGWGAALLVAQPGFAQAPPRQSPQAAYDAAQAAFDERQWLAAEQGFAALLPQDRAARLTYAQAVISARMGYALLQERRFAVARAAADRALRWLPPVDDNTIAALNTAGQAARFAYNYSDAADYYRRMLTTAQAANLPAQIVNARIGFAMSAMTLDPVAVAHMLDHLLDDPAARDLLDRNLRALVEGLRARAALNQGDLTTARRWNSKAIDDSGGLTEKVTLSQVAIRNDAAIIATLQHRDDDAKKYFAYTGAGHLPDMDWIGKFRGELPVCGELTGARPDDTVVVQFSIGRDGEVDGAMPIYASRPGDLGTVFAKAVSNWSWDPASLAKVKLFWLNSLVLELRCTTRPSPKSLAQPLWYEVSNWLEQKGVTFDPDEPGFITVDDLQLQLQTPEAVPALERRLLADGKDFASSATRLRAIFDRHGAPLAAYALLDARVASEYDKGSRSRAKALGGLVDQYRAAHPQTTATAWLMLQQAFALENARDFKHAEPIFAAVSSWPASALPTDSPIRHTATLHAAMLATRLGKTVDGSIAARAMDLDPEQCELFDTHPVAESVSIASSAFPEQAMRWGFEGYVKISYDITNIGHVSSSRALVAYPPFVFSEATEQAALRFRYLPPTIRGQAVGCSAETNTVRYRMN